jgi:hypothetical protein
MGRDEKIGILLGIVVTVMITIFLISYFSSVPEIQDFPGLQQELDILEDRYFFRQVDFEGKYNSSITISGWMGWLGSTEHFSTPANC